MKDKITIAIDAMGGENSPKKILSGIEISLKLSKEIFFYLYGDEKILVESFKEMIVNKDLRDSFGRKGRTHVERLFHRDYQSKKIETIYKETLNLV